MIAKAQSEGKMHRKKSGSQIDILLFCLFLWLGSRDFFEVGFDFFGTRRAQVVQKKLSEFFVMAHNGLITFDAHDAEATRSDFPDLAFLWWFLFHAFNLSEKLILSTGFFIF